MQPVFLIAAFYGLLWSKCTVHSLAPEITVRSYQQGGSGENGTISRRSRTALWVTPPLNQNCSAEHPVLQISEKNHVIELSA